MIDTFVTLITDTLGLNLLEICCVVYIVKTAIIKPIILFCKKTFKVGKLK